ncbi:MAG: 2-C-methyl-D-erythritol 2,4-cyclodiphosphate synthase [Deltaproteobacteria bacterium]|nr:2-C-methyl-D-erythritol 2,4-cyclodiphosphate synthase [Deltaproteobacteria bacterium]MBW1929871.1 2-C-methyl-D-erythritol 2,4-cyclodiphosphate synthase [Deltaproteobacteria bacterium]MBW2025756.1 2-C-methyl-D-erythritol 2,4-cyclodiphosphate synthase [Deltaproteobacteria bacterium]MBW2126980.1 2-C-methyl-D-erythritol 2,4-cyclodiphosphate synthase [Deltaproteobacteria bacterium]
MIRIGFGYDAHRLVRGRRLVLGGVDIEWHLGLYGHSDADVLTHAIMDAILGALGKGDIGQHFPDTDPRYKDASSLSLLAEVVGWMKDEGYEVNNLDASIVAQAPKLSRHMAAMKKRLGEVLGVEDGRINLKATTTEEMGFCGREEGMAAYAVVTIKKA